jgi:ketosteroid isomerase-like protein
MTEGSLQAEAPDVMVERLAQATNARDLDAIVDCFAPDYRNETPLHPSRGFVGRDQVRRNWEQILTHVPDLRATVVRRVVSGDTVWSEWEMRGTRRDGAAHLMRGVIIFEVRDRRAASARFFLEPAEDTGETASEAVRHIVAPTTGSAS